MQAYLRCFPYNVFNLRPDYGLTLACLFLLCVQVVYVVKVDWLAQYAEEIWSQGGGAQVDA